MTTLRQQDTIKQYLGDNVSTVFVYPFMILENADIAVYVTPAGQADDPAQDKKVLDVDYSVQNAGDTLGGTVTFVVPPGPFATVTLSREIEARVDTNFEDARTFSGANLDYAFLRTTLVEQQNRTYATKRNLSFKITSYLPDAYIQSYTQLPLPGNGQIWIGGEDGILAVDLEQNPDVSTLRSELQNASLGTDGARIVGYYDPVNAASTTVQAFLANLIPFIRTNFPDDFIKPGTMLDFAGTAAPTGYLVCDGAAVSRTTYADLFAAISTTWGVGDGSTTFNLPNLQRKTTIGSGGTIPAGSPVSNSVGSTGGEELHILTVAEMPSHNHAGSFLDRQAGSFGGGGGGAITTSAGGSEPVVVASQGSDAGHNNMQPSAVVLKIIKI